VNSKLILDGSGEDDPEGYYSFDENPHAINPPWGYVYSANNQSYKSGDIIHPGYYLPEDRARRIVRLLDAKNDWSVADVQSMMLDITSENSAEIAQSMVKVLSEIPEGEWPSEYKNMALQTINQLREWNGAFDDYSSAPILFNKLLFLINKNLMSDELGEDMFNLYNGTHLMKRSNQPLFANTNSLWWDDVNTTEIESPNDIVKKSMIEGMSQLSAQLGMDISKWKWSSVHTLEHNHNLGTVSALRPYFNVGPFETTGGTDVINNLQFKLEEDGTYEVLAGPSCRRIVDFSNVNGNSWSILPTGQSGNIMSPHYKDQAEMYIQGKFRKQMMDKNEIMSNSTDKSVFNPR
jgi:penicillin amidase